MSRLQRALISTKPPVPEGPPSVATTIPVPSIEMRGEATWLVDDGDSEQLRKMTTFELWMAIARRELHDWVLVWRSGIVDWTPVNEVPDLSCAFPNEPEEAAPRESMTRLRRAERITARPIPITLLDNECDSATPIVRDTQHEATFTEAPATLPQAKAS